MGLYILGLHTQFTPNRLLGEVFDRAPQVFRILSQKKVHLYRLVSVAIHGFPKGSVWRTHTVFNSIPDRFDERFLSNVHHNYSAIVSADYGRVV